MNKLKSFNKTIKEHELNLERKKIEVLQINMGKYCNMACLHCHVEAGPKRTEIMERKTVERILEITSQEQNITTVDITGGAPELNPHFRYLIEQLSSQGKHVIDRCNLTVLFEKGQESTAKFLAEHKVEIVASLPCYQKENVDKQRGKGAFNNSIKALLLLNDLGYGKEGSECILNLVYNPVGAHLPPNQQVLEQDYKKNLKNDLGIEFNRLFTITNIPIKRYVT